MAACSAVERDTVCFFVDHIGTGRISHLRMPLMNLWELGDSNEAVSLRELFRASQKIATVGSIDINRLAYLTCR